LTGGAKQLYLPFAESCGGEVPESGRGEAPLSFRLPRPLKEQLLALAKTKNLSLSGLLKDLVSGCLSGGGKTGRGNVNTAQLERLKAYMLAHPEGVNGAGLARAAGVSHARAMRLLDAADAGGFLTYEEGSGKQTRYFVYRRG
jgi:hypothetical protein